MLMLGPDAPLAKFATIWQGMLNGLVTPLDLTVRIQAPPSGSVNAYSDLAWFEIADSYITEFSDGTASPAYIVIQPGVITTLNQAKDSLNARYVGLPLQASPTFQILGESRMMGVYQNSGGESRVIVDNSGAVTMVPFGDVSVTAVARVPGVSHYADLQNFHQLQMWVDTVLGGSGSPYRSVVFTSVPAVGAVAKTVQYADCLPTRINLINPVLVNVNGGVAPYVYDLRLRFAGVQAGPQ